LPGFGRPAPEGFDATKEAYVSWLLAELPTQSGPVDIVGHDWGALLVVRAVSLEPRRVRSWAVGSQGRLHRQLRTRELDPDLDGGASGRRRLG
jgi:pimeloyl-ACP methyl ester carboxylesterase